MDFIKKFDSVGAFKTYLDSTPVSSRFAKSPSSHYVGRESWFGTPDYQTADDLMIYGDAASAAKIASAACRLRGGLDGSRRAFVDSVAGFTPNVPAYLRGLPCSMIAQTRTATKNKVVNLTYNMAASSMVDASEIIDAGAKVLAAVVAAEKQGYRVNLYAAAVAKNTEGKEIHGLFIKIKDAASYVTPAKMAYFLVNPSFLRRHMFAYIERQKSRASIWVNGYGCACNSTEQTKTAAESVGISGACLTFSQVQKMTVQEIADVIAAGK